MGFHFTLPRPCRGECLNEPHSPTSQAYCAHDSHSLPRTTHIASYAREVWFGSVRLHSPRTCSLVPQPIFAPFLLPIPQNKSGEEFLQRLKRQATKTGDENTSKIKLLTMVNHQQTFVWLEGRYQITHKSIWYLRKLSKTPSIQTTRQFYVVLCPGP